MQNLSYENEFYLHMNENSFSYERLALKRRYKKTRKWPIRTKAIDLSVVLFIMLYKIEQHNKPSAKPFNDGYLSVLFIMR